MDSFFELITNIIKFVIVVGSLLFLVMLFFSFKASQEQSARWEEQKRINDDREAQRVLDWLKIKKVIYFTGHAPFTDVPFHAVLARRAPYSLWSKRTMYQYYPDNFAVVCDSKGRHLYWWSYLDSYQVQRQPSVSLSYQIDGNTSAQVTTTKYLNDQLINAHGEEFSVQLLFSITDFDHGYRANAPLALIKQIARGESITIGVQGTSSISTIELPVMDEAEQAAFIDACIPKPSAAQIKAARVAAKKAEKAKKAKKAKKAEKAKLFKIRQAALTKLDTPIVRGDMIPFYCARTNSKTLCAMGKPVGMVRITKSDAAALCRKGEKYLCD